VVEGKQDVADIASGSANSPGQQLEPAQRAAPLSGLAGAQATGWCEFAGDVCWPSLSSAVCAAITVLPAGSIGGIQGKQD
jgi:hypothetical protein